jgi:glyoxylase-like metal-dependent hydrolase (beta-lactamase superfamily II)/rhodanese-related sulfurtransferase
MILKQIRSTDGTGTLSYIIGDEATRKAAVIDPNIEDVEIIRETLDEMNLVPVYIFDTHTHVDHVSGAEKLREIFGAEVVMHENTRSKPQAAEAGAGDPFGIGDILRANAAMPVDRYVTDREILHVGKLPVEVIHTPGHTDNHVALKVDDAIFTGDLLLVGQAGRSDLPGGDPGQQYDSLTRKILTLSDDTRIYPGHDYDDNVFAFLGQERKENPFLQSRTKAEYIEFVKDFFPPIVESAHGEKVTVQCGTKRVSVHGEPFTEIDIYDLEEMMKSTPSPFLLDVREPFELIAFGAIPGVTNIPAGQVRFRTEDLPADKSTPMVAICQSGGRSYEIAHFLATHGYQNVYNLRGGTSTWRNNGLPVESPRMKVA